MNDFSFRLKEARNGENQSSFAARLGLKTAVYSHYETGKREPSLDVIIRIAQTLGVSVDWLLGLKPETGGGVAVTGSGNAVAIGTGAKASTRTVHAGRRECESCAKCPHKVLADAVRKAAGKS